MRGFKRFEAGRQIIAAGLVLIIEPEVDIHCSEKKPRPSVAQSDNPREAKRTARGVSAVIA